MICPLRNVDCGCNKRVTDRDKRIATLEEQVAANTFSQEAFDILAQRCKTLEAVLREALDCDPAIRPVQWVEWRIRAAALPTQPAPPTDAQLLGYVPPEGQR